MDVNQALALLGGLSPKRFMQRHWQRKPLLVRQAVPPDAAPLDRRTLFQLATRDDVRSRLVLRDASQGALQPSQSWRLRQGPFRRLPALKQSGWTLLVQGVDAQVDAARRLIDAFRFVPDARLDDLMISYATDGGGVGPHFDSYDVFLLQVQGQRRWRIGRQKDMTLQRGVPLKILSQFQPEQEYLLDPGDMLYLPPRYAHDGVAVGECMTCSIGFRAPDRGELARELLQRLGDDAGEGLAGRLYRDPAQPAVSSPAELPAELVDFAQQAVRQALAEPAALQRALGEWLTEPKADAWFEGEGTAGPATGLPPALRLDRQTRMLYDRHHVYINGEAYRAAGRDARLMRRLADQRGLDRRDLAQLSGPAQGWLMSWMQDGWLHPGPA